MRFYRCQCGESQAWSSMGVAPCRRCSKCGSDLAESPQGHQEPRPHRMRAGKVEVQTDAGPMGGVLTRCQYCQQTAAEIRARGEPMEDAP